MKILILTNFDVGLYRFRKELLEKLIERNHEVFVSVPNGMYRKPIEEMGCIFIETDVERRGMNPFKDLMLIRKYKKIIKDVRPDVVLTYTIKPNVYGGIASASLKVPQIANITGLGTAAENPGLTQKLIIWLYKFAFRKTSKVFFQNKENYEFFVKHKINISDYDILPGSGVNLNNYKVLEYPDDSKIKFLFISRIMKEKGIDFYLSTATTIVSKYKNVEFHICGFCEDEYKGKLHDLADRGTVIYHGMVDNVSEFLENIHCVIHPTYYPEGMSNVLLESCASGRPIITTDRSGCREIVDDGINGYMIRIKNQGDLVRAVEEFLTLSYEEKKAMGIAGRKKVEKQFDRQIVVNKYIEEIEREVN